MIHILAGPARNLSGQPARAVHAARSRIGREAVA
jgi:hypothetical protein